LFLEKLRQSTTIEPILLRLFDLLEIEDYHELFSSLNFQTIDSTWLQLFGRLCLKRYVEFDDICFSTSTSLLNNKNESKSIVENYLNIIIENLKKHFTLKYFLAILNEIEHLNRLKFEQISKQLNENNRLIQDIVHLLHHENDDKDDSIIHLSSTPAQTINRPTYINYKPVHMVYLRENLFIKNDQDQRLPSKGITNSFVADLINTKSINILDETTGKTYDIQTKWLYFAKPCESNVILQLKLRVLIIDSQTGRRRYGLIGEEPGKNNDYRCLVFYTDDSKNMSANYHSSSQIHICLDQTFSTHTHECQNEYLDRYFASYPERLMLRVKEGTFVRVRNVFTNFHNNSFIPALVTQIDGSMIQIELSHSKQRKWLYRGSPLLDQMNNYYSTQTRAAANNGVARRTARQHLSAKRTNAPEIICLNEQTGQSTNTNKDKSVRTAEQAVDEPRPVKRVRTSNEQEIIKNSTLQSIDGPRALRSRQTNSSSSNLTSPTISSTNETSSNINNFHRQASSSSLQSRSTTTTTTTHVIVSFSFHTLLLFIYFSRLSIHLLELLQIRYFLN